MDLSISNLEDDLDVAMRSNDIAAVRLCADKAASRSSESASVLVEFAQGFIEFRSGNFPTALEHYAKVLAHYTNVADIRGQARAHIALARLHRSTSEFELVMRHSQQSLELAEKLEMPILIADSYASMSRIFLHQGRNSDAFEYNSRALELYTNNNNTAGIAHATYLLGDFYNLVGDYPRAMENMHAALALFELVEDRRSEASVLANLASVYGVFGDHTQAATFNERALEIYENINDTASLAHFLGNYAIHFHNIGQYNDFVRITKQAIELCVELDLKREQAFYSTNLFVDMINKGLFDEAQEVMEQHGEVMKMFPSTAARMQGSLGIMHSALGDYDEARVLLEESLRLAIETGHRDIIADCVLDLRDFCKKCGDFEGYVKHNETYQEMQNELLGAEQQRKIVSQVKQREMDNVRREHDKHLAVLHSTLPKSVADRVARGEVVNDNFDNAVVLFLDVVGFTTNSAQLQPNEVITLLQSMFSSFDAMCAKHSITKIKTIGDSYMCVAFPSDNHLRNAVSVALGMINSSFSWPHTNTSIQFRIGMHIGPIAAGVLGTERLQYDVWGDTVNIASRMESTSEPGRIHVSEQFARAMETTGSNSERLEARGEVDIKGIGLMTTYWLNA